MKAMNPFGPVWGASGVENFFGEGYPTHKYLKLCPGFTFDGVTFVAKTTTLWPRRGNMPLDFTTPKEFLPKSIWVNPREGIALNAVGLSGPGLGALLADGRWQARTRPFGLSFMSVAGSVEERFLEFKIFVNTLAKYLKDFQALVILQINFSCPNVGVAHNDLIEEIRMFLDHLKTLNLNVFAMPKLVVTMDPKEAVHIAEHPMCWGICVSNTIPFMQLASVIEWEKYFPDGVSPLRKRGLEQDGGLSGVPLRPIVCNWIREARQAGVKCHINGGGGILNPSDVTAFKEAGADSVFLGSIAFLRPWRMKKVIEQAYIDFAFPTQRA